MNLSKSKYCSGLQCKKILWLEENKPEEKEESNESILEQGTKVHDYAKKLFGNCTNIEYNSDLKVMISDTQRALKENINVITEASFAYNDNFASIDILKCLKNGYEIYEVKSSSEIKDIFIDDISYQYYILNNLNMNVVKCFIVYINNKYVRKGNLDLDKLFIKEDVTNLVIQKQKEVENNNYTCTDECSNNNINYLTQTEEYIKSMKSYTLGYEFKSSYYRIIACMTLLDDDKLYCGSIELMR